MSTTRAVSFLKNIEGIAFLLCVGAEDSIDDDQTEKLFLQLGGKDPDNKDRIYLQTYPVKLRGTQLLGKGIGIEKHIMIFLEAHLKKLNDEWRDRQSRL